MSQPLTFVPAKEFAKIPRFEIFGHYNTVLRKMQSRQLPHWNQNAGNGRNVPQIPIEIVDRMLAGEQVDPAWFAGYLPGTPEAYAFRAQLERGILPDTDEEEGIAA